MSNDDKIASAISLLEDANAEFSEQPAMVVMPPDSGDFIIGNKGGFVQLAIASLKASSGQEQPFKNQKWVTVAELDWAVSGLKYDASAHIYLPPETGIWHRALGYLLPLGIAICLAVGL